MTDDPARHLVDPVISGDVPPYFMTNVGGILDYLSPTAWINELVKEFIDFDILAEVVQPLTGDWEAFSRYGDSLHNMSSTLGELGEDVQAAALAMDPHWNGHAADSAHAYFSKTAAALKDHQAVVDEVGAEYQKIALSIWLIAEQVKTILQAVVDRAIYAGICAVAGSALIETGVGAIAGYAASAYFVVQALRQANSAAAIIQTAIGTITAFFTIVGSIMHRLDQLGTIPDFDSPYLHPATR